MWVLIFQRLALDFFLDIITFPVWWYTGGTTRVFLGCIEWVKEANTSMAPGLWLKNIFVPMFGQRDWQGRLMSIFMRLVNVIGRSIGLFIWSVLVFSFLILWLVFPIFVVSMMMQALFI